MSSGETITEIGEVEEGETRDLTFICKGERFGMVEWKFMRHSVKYRSQGITERGNVCISSIGRLTSVRSFLEACDRDDGCANVTIDNSGDLLLLCDEWKTEKVRRSVEDTIRKNPDLLLIRAIIEGSQSGIDTFSLERELQSKFLTLMSHDCILEVGLEVLDRVLKMDDHLIVREHVHEVLDFLIHCLDVFGLLGSILFAGIDVHDLAREELYRLDQRDDFDWSFLNNSIRRSILGQEVQISRYEQCLKDYAERLADTERQLLSAIEGLGRYEALYRAQPLQMDSIPQACPASGPVKDADGPEKEEIRPVAKASDASVQGERQVRDFPYTDAAFDGVIAGLTRECGGNVAVKGVVVVTARDRCDGKPERCIVNLSDKGSYYCSSDEAGAWFCLDFKDQLVRPTHYSIRTYNARQGGAHLSSWKVKGSVDGDAWAVLHVQSGTEDLNGRYAEKTYAISKPKAFRFIRLKMTGKNLNGNNMLVCSGFELFGSLDN